MALFPGFGDLSDRFNREIEEIVQLLVFGIADSLDDIAANGADIALLELLLVDHEVTGGDTAGEDRGRSVLNGEVGKLGAENFICGADSHETVVDEEVAAHHFVDYELLAESERRILVEDALGCLGFLGSDLDRLEGVMLLGWVVVHGSWGGGATGTATVALAIN